ncbi:Replication factor C subunit [Entamoeba marina]
MSFNPRPTDFSALDHAKEANELLENLSNNSDMPHMLFHGPPGSGKYTRAMAYLQKMYGPNVNKVETGTATIEIKGKNKDITIRSSPHHVELIPSDSQESDKAVIQGYVKALTNYQTLNSVLRKSQQQKLSFAPSSKDSKLKKNDTNEKKFRVVMIFDADKLTSDAQQSLRRTMEIGSKVCRFILFAHNPCAIIKPIRSRCVLVRVPSPTKEEMCDIVRKIGGGDNTENLVGISRGNIRVAEGAAFEYRLTGSADHLYWKKEYSRNDLLDLLTIVSPEHVFFQLFSNLMEMKTYSNEIKIQIPSLACKHSREMALGGEPMYHIEAFLLGVCALFADN